MSMMLLALAAAGAAHAAPPTITPAIPIISGCRNCSSDDDGAVTTFDVEIRAGGETLWSGPMRVSGHGNASLSRMKTDAPPATCSGRFGYGGGRRTSLQVSLNRNRFGSEGPRYQMHVSWEHPTENSCGTNEDSRSVGLTESFTLDPGAGIVLHGDGGLEVRVRRR